MRKFQLILASAAATLAIASPAKADNGPPGLRAFFSGNSGGTPFSGELFYLGSSVPGGFITFTINGQQFSFDPILVGEADGPVLLPPTPTNGSAAFVAGNYPFGDYAIVSVWNISGQIGNTYVGVSPQVADILNGGYAGAGFTSGGLSFGGPVTYHFDYAPAFPEPATWAMMLLGFGVVGFALRRSRERSHHRHRLNRA